MAIGLPTIDINFKKLAATLIQRSSSGIVALIVKDDTDTTYEVKEYKSQQSIEASKWTTASVKYIKDVFNGGAAKVIVIPIDTESVSIVADAITALGSRKYNWIGLAEGTASEQLELTAYVKEQETARKNIKAVVYNAISPDSQHIVNFVNTSVTYADGGKVSGEKFVPRLLGLLAGLPLTRSSTYVSLEDLISVEEPANIEDAVNAGKFVLFNDQDVVRVARGVNSLVTLLPTISEDFKKIIIVETMDLIREDITNTFKYDYLGKFKNKYDYQILFITAINSYLEALAEEDVLDNTYSNISYVDVEMQRSAWVASGKLDAVDWDEQTVRNNTFRSNVYLGGSIKITDAMEDLQFNVELQ